MKTRATLLLLWVSLGLWAQAPDNFKYQAVLRDASGNVKANTATTIVLSLLEGSVSGSLVYAETHVVTTNEFGLVNLTVGNGTNKIGNLGTIDWSANSYFLNVKVDGTDFGTSQLMSVPYALYAKTAGNGFSGNYNDLTNKPAAATTTETGLMSATDKTKLEGIAAGAEVNVNADWTATTGDGLILNKPVLFSGSFADLTSKPTTIGGYGITDAFSGSYNNLTDKPTLFDGTWNSLTGKPTFATVATSGSYNDLLNKPILPGPGVSGQTLRHDGTNWTASSLIYNNGTRIGIGTATPDAKLTIGTPGATFNDYGITSDSRIGVVNGSGNRGAMILQSGGTYGILTAFNYGTNATMPIVMQPYGNNVGIGTVTPDAKLTIGTPGATFFDYGITSDSRIGVVNGSGNRGAMILQSGGTYGILTAFNYETNATMPVVMQPNGNNVGIGTTSPHAPLQFSNATSSRKIVLYESANNDHQFHGFGVNANTLRYQVPGTTDAHVFYASTSATASTELLRINGNGRVGIGTPSPAAKLEVSGDIIVNGLNLGKGSGASASNTTIGYQSLYSNTTGDYNTANGYQSLYSNTTGDENTTIGYRSLYANTTGSGNTANGYGALQLNTTGNYNTANGVSALSYNTTGYSNTANGSGVLSYNTTGNSNTANGAVALNSNTTGNSNTASGYGALYANVANHRSTAVGYNAMFWADNRTTGRETFNTAVGYEALRGSINAANNAGQYNTAVGDAALRANSSGRSNTAVGVNALYLVTSGNYNTAIGDGVGSIVTTGSNLTLLGYDAEPSSATAIDQITLGNGFISSLRCNVQSISSLSDQRDKKNITELSLGLNFLMQLKPRQFNWDKREWYEGNYSDGSLMQSIPTAGFIAQELDEVQTQAKAEWLNLVLKDNPEKLEATYGNLLPVMVKAIQEQQQQIEKLKAENAQLKSELEQRLQKLEALLTTNHN